MRMSYRLPKLLLLGALTIISSYCTKEQQTDVMPKPSASTLTASQLAADTSFVRMVEANTQLTGVLYGKLRKLGNDQARHEMQTHVATLLASPTKANVLLAIKEMGFDNPAQFVALTNELSKRSQQVQKRFGDYRKQVDGKVLAEAYHLSVPLTSIAQAQYWMPTKGNQTAEGGIPGEGTICPECHFNNCDECNNPGGGGSGGGGGGGGSTNACYNTCMQLRTDAMYNARVQMELAVWQSCGNIYTEDFLYSCFGDPSNPNQSAACQAAACAASAYNHFQQRMQLIEEDATNCIYSC